MRIVVFDVSNGFCAIAVCDNGYSLMLDCGSHTDKPNPVEAIASLSKPDGWLSHMVDFQPNGTTCYPLTLLSISHPDEDHIRNIKTVRDHFRPALLHRRRLDDFPSQTLSDNDKLSVYREDFCDKYRGGKMKFSPNWAFERRIYFVPMDELLNNPQFSDGKITNNSSVVTVLEYAGRKVVFGGDLETVGWNWLMENHTSFRQDLSTGIDVFVAAHHGHKSGYPEGLFSEFGYPALSLLSKGREFKDRSDVDPRYSKRTIGYPVKNLANEVTSTKYSVTSRKSGRMYLDIRANGELSVFCEK